MLIAACALSVAAGAPAAPASSRTALVADFGGGRTSEDGRVVRLDLRTGRPQLVSDNRRSVFSGEPSVLEPYGLAVARDGRLLLPSASGLRGEPAIFEVDPSSGRQSVFSSNGESVRRGGLAALRTPGGLVQTADGNAGGSLVRIDAETHRQSVVASDLGDLRDLTLDRQGRAVVAAGGIVRIDPETGEREQIADEASFQRAGWMAHRTRPDAVAVLADGRIIASTGGSIVEVRADGRHEVLFEKHHDGKPDLSARIDAIGLDGTDAIVFTTSDAVGSGDTTVERLDLVGGDHAVLATDRSNRSPESRYLRLPGVVSHPAHGILVAAIDPEGESLHRGLVVGVDRQTGAQTVVSSGATPGVPTGAQAFGDPTGIALEASGGMLVSERFEFGGALVRVNPESGKLTVLASRYGRLGQAPASLLEAPRGVALGPDGVAYLTVTPDFSRSRPRIVRVDTATGEVALVTSNRVSRRVGGASALRRPSGIAVTRSGSLLITDTQAFDKGGGIIRVDPQSGRQTVVSSNRRSRRAGGARPFGEPNALAIGARGRLFVTDRHAPRGAKAVIVVNARTGAARRLSTNRLSRRAGGRAAFQGPRGVALAPGGGLLISDQGFRTFGGGAVIKVGPRSGHQTRIYGNPNRGRRLIDAPSAIVIEPARPRGRG